MSLTENIIRADVRALSAYHVPDASGFVKLDAMENPYTLPVSLQHELGKRLGALAPGLWPGWGIWLLCSKASGTKLAPGALRFSSTPRSACTR